MASMRLSLVVAVGSLCFVACGDGGGGGADAGADAGTDVENDGSGAGDVSDNDAADSTSSDATVDSRPDDTSDASDADAEVSVDAADAADADTADVPGDTLPDVEGDVFPPRGHVAINFTVDDTANATYTESDGLAWKGSFSFDSDTSVITFDGSWAGPYPMLWDDGGWDAGGHEPQGQVAGDHIWGVTVWFASPEVDTLFEYGAVRGSVDGGDGTWIWVGPNGSLVVPADSTAAIDASGLIIGEFGTVDLRLTLDVSNSGANLTPEFQGAEYSSVAVKADAWDWAEITMRDDGTGGDAMADDDVFTFVLSANLAPHSGLLWDGDGVEFMFVLGGVEYRLGSDGQSAGARAFSDYVMPGMWNEEFIGVNDVGNLRVTIGSAD